MSAEGSTPKEKRFKVGQTIYQAYRTHAKEGELYGPWEVMEATVKSFGLTDLYVDPVDKEKYGHRTQRLDAGFDYIFTGPEQAKKFAEKKTEEQKDYPPPYKVF